MAFWIASSPHNHIQKETSALMRLVIFATIPGILAQWYFFGWGNIIHIGLATATALLCEFFVLSLRNKPIKAELLDGSAILTAILLAICLPAVAPWWISVLGAIFAIAVVKQLYGGLGHNPFNPAMAAYVMLLISFPVEMTTWLPPRELWPVEYTFMDTVWMIFTESTQLGYSAEQLRTHIDGYTMATPLDTLKTGLTTGLSVSEVTTSPVFGDYFASGWEWVNAGFLLGGIVLLAKKAIHWAAPVSFLAMLWLCSLIGYMVSPDLNPSTLFYWFSGATMLGTFFILTDPVSGATSFKGRLVFGALAGLLVYLIRNFGGYPDAVAFAVLLCNMAAPLIDVYTRPRTFGHQTHGLGVAGNKQGAKK